MDQKRIIVPTGGNLKHNLERAKTAFDFGRENSKYMISGGDEPPDWIIQDYLLLHGVSPTNIGIDYDSKNSKENLLNCLRGQKGLFYNVSYPMHLERFELSLEELQRKGKLSKDVDLFRVETKQSVGDFFYGCLGEIKDVYHLDKLNEILGKKIKSLLG